MTSHASRNLTLLLVVVIAAGLCAPAWCAAPVTMQGLLHEMVDMQRLATMPDPGIESDQQSSYDRASTAPDKDNWFANGDAAQFIRSEQNGDRTEWVMAEMDGPGAIVRLWSANPDGGGNVRIYIDGAAKPALEEDFLVLTSAALPTFPAPFSGRRALGANLYFPLPYQTRCKVTVDKPGLYYHVGYKTYPAGTQVEPFSMDRLPALKPAMDEVGAILANPAESFTTKGATAYPNKTTLAPGQSAILHSFTGPAAISRFEMRLDVPADQVQAALRECALSIRFDGEDKASVWAPLGDYFGSTPGINPYQSLPSGMLKDGLCYSNWFMPFGKYAEFTLTNESANPVTVDTTAWACGVNWAEGKWLRFHAGWRNEWLPADPVFLDWRMLDATGPGRFVGVMLGVMNTKPGWWGEGDEKVWVDDDTLPSFFGTGSEDYFGYAWCNPELFTHAYHNQSICTGPGNFGYSAVARYHISDDIPFDKHMLFDIEKWDGADREMACTTYWYAVPGATDFFKPVPVDQRHVLPLPEPFRVKGAAEGESLQVSRITGGETSLQDVSGDFSGGRHLWWTKAKPGDILEVRVPVAQAGRYTITLGLTKSWDYGIQQPLINGKPVGEPLDLFAEAITPLTVDLGALDLAAGDLLVGLHCVGTNPAARPANYMAGIDYVLVKPVE
jgi:hypothetical protein